MFGVSSVYWPARWTLLHYIWWEQAIRRLMKSAAAAEKGRVPADHRWHPGANGRLHAQGE